MIIRNYDILDDITETLFNLDVIQLFLINTDYLEDRNNIENK